MDPADHTPELVDRDVLDAAGQRLGLVDSPYRDVEDPDIVFAAVAMIRRRRRRLVFVSLVGATTSAESATVQCGALLARRAPPTRRECRWRSNGSPGSDVVTSLGSSLSATRSGCL